MESQGKLLGQTENNPNHNVSAFSLKSGKSYEDPSKYEPEEEVEKETGEVLGKKEAEKRGGKETPNQLNPVLKEYKPISPFASRLKSGKREREDEEIMDTFRKVEVNIPRLDVIKQVSRYAKL